MRYLRLASLLLPLLAVCSGAQAAPPDQRYRLVGEPDVASWLILHPDGRFDYMLSAGALDEQAQGRWSSDGKTVHITTDPKPKPALFSAGAAERHAGAPFTIKVVWPDNRGLAGVHFRLTFDDGVPIDGYTQEDGWSLDPADKRTPRSITFAVPMFQLQSPAFAIRTENANSLIFVLTPNDLGTVDFENLPLTVGTNRLIMHRGGADLTYVTAKN
jgi:hypothetical protein